MENTAKSRVVLVCTAGITTGLLVKVVEIAAKERGVNLEISSAPSIVAEQLIQQEKIDVLMIGPQLKYEVKRLEELLNYNGIPHKLISEESYQILDGESILDEIVKLLPEQG